MRKPQLHRWNLFTPFGLYDVVTWRKAQRLPDGYHLRIGKKVYNAQEIFEGKASGVQVTKHV